MNIDNRPRQTGKTHDLIAFSAASGMVIVVPNLRQAGYVATQAVARGLVIPTPVAASTLTEETLWGRDGVLVDEWPAVLSQLLGANVHTATSTARIRPSSEVARDYNSSS